MLNKWTLEMWKEKWHDQRKELSEVYGVLYMAERENEALREECTRLLEKEWSDVK